MNGKGKAVIREGVDKYRRRIEENNDVLKVIKHHTISYFSFKRIIIHVSLCIHSLRFK